MRSFLMFLVIIMGILWQPTAVATIKFEQGEVRQPMPGRTVTAGYVSLLNTGSELVELVAAASERFQRIELHTHIEQQGMMRMVEVAGIEMDAGARLVMQPGGLHLMLFEPTQPLVLGETIQVTLYFQDQTELHVQLPVTAMPRR